MKVNLQNDMCICDDCGSVVFKYSWSEHVKFHQDVTELKRQVALIDAKAKKPTCRCINSGRSMCRCA
jgi:hypothetical protein